MLLLQWKLVVVKYIKATHPFNQRMWGLPPRAQITSYYNLMVYWITFIERLWTKNVMTISVTILYFKHVEKFGRDGDLI